jgi:small-conductance mechanosensitive channel/CRP-like cAMP-binding protein
MVWSFVAVLLFLVLRLWGTPEVAAQFPPAYGVHVQHFIGVGLAVAIAMFVDRSIRLVFWNGYLRRKRKQDTPALIEDIVTAALVALGVSFGLFFEEGVSFTGLLTASGATAIIVGIALQAVIQDLFSGLSVNFDGSYALGDWLTIYSDQFPDYKYGRVTGITWRSTFMQLEDGTRLMVPNRMVTSNPVANHSRPRGPKRLSVTVPVDYRFSSQRAKAILVAEVLRVVREKGLSRTPDPDVIISEITSDTVTFTVRFYADPDRISPQKACSIVAEAMHDALLRHGLPNPVSQVELVPPPELGFGRKQLEEALSRVPMFESVLDKEQLATLAGTCEVRTLSPDSAFIRQGESAASMFVILEGAARVLVADGDDVRDVAVLVGGDIVGEMSLMTGAPRTATVMSVTTMRALEVTKASIEALLASKPELLKRFGRVLAQRQMALAELANSDTDTQEIETDLLARMRDFFARVFW